MYDAIALGASELPAGVQMADVARDSGLTDLVAAAASDTVSSAQVTRSARHNVSAGPPSHDQPYDQPDRWVC
jgi:hypothetical protein